LGQTSADRVETAPRHEIANFDNHIETGFQLATAQGPLCAEPIEGLAFFLETLDVDAEALEREIGEQFLFFPPGC
jgi:ribosome assembly protein 1